MSLKLFHIVFISLSALLAVGFAGWEIRNYLSDGNPLALVVGIISLASAVGLVLYGIRFLKKLKHVGYI